MSENWFYPFRGTAAHRTKAELLCKELGLRSFSELFRLFLSNGCEVEFKAKIVRLKPPDVD
jgi:hypothetical protein